MIYEERRIAARRLGACRLLAALHGSDRLDLVFGAGLDAMPTVAGPEFQPVGAYRIGGGARITGTCSATSGTADLEVNGTTYAIPLVPQEQDLFAGKTAAIVIRNGESGAIVAAWLQYHAEVHGLQGAVILDMAGPTADRAFADSLREALATSPPATLETVVRLTSDVALGKPDLGPEALPINAPDAPGKDRMTPPAPDPWTAPLGEPVVFELIRHWFLGRARAVMSLEAYDLLRPLDGETVFDRVARSDAGIVMLVGERIYPWALRKGEPAGFGDHICRRFDGTRGNARWCVAPAAVSPDTVWRHVRVVGTQATEALPYDRCMALRHREAKVSEIVPKSSLVEDQALIERARKMFDCDPLRPPKVPIRKRRKKKRVTIVTTMKNEGPFILEWISYHRTIGVSDFLVYTNDCTDGTDSMLKLLGKHGIVQHRENPFRSVGLKPQHAALQAAESERLVEKADWAVCMDVDEFVNIHVGNGRLKDLFAAVGDANLISMTWRLFGNSDIHAFEDRFVIDQFTRCAPHLIRKPHQAWGFKTLFENIGLFKKLGVHRPKGLKPQLVDQIRWVNGSGRPLPQSMFRNAWRSTTNSVGYDLVTLNHYAVRSAESFLVKRDRGRVNHVDRDQGMSYWFRMNNNEEEDRSIQRMSAAVKKELAQLKKLDGVAEAHEHSVRCHRAKIAELKAREDYRAFYDELTGNRMETLSRMHHLFGRDTFLAGPEVIPDDVVFGEHPKGYIFQPKNLEAGANHMKNE
ncbi:MAG: glycosyltransferase family 2 protein [Rhodobacter sp.]|nr:glycosyltransferase family 2 protein [Rhodobacter sp.]